MSAESSKKPSVVAQAPAASQKAAVRTAVGVVDLASRAGWKGLFARTAAARPGLPHPAAREAGRFRNCGDRLSYMAFDPGASIDSTIHGPVRCPRLGLS